MSAAEIKAEMRYRYIERLGLLCGAGIPSTAERALARSDVRTLLRKLKEAGIKPEKNKGLTDSPVNARRDFKPVATPARG